MSFRFQVSGFRLAMILIIAQLLSVTIMAQNKPCQFNAQTLQFVGKPIVQARCLLRPNKIGGNLDEELKSLPQPLEKLIGEKVKVKTDAVGSGA